MGYLEKNTRKFRKYHITMVKFQRDTLLPPWNTVLLEKLTDFQLVKKFPTFSGTRRFITAFTSARQLSVF
jgi:hypothetical protein